MYTKIVAHNKKEETLKAAKRNEETRRVKKKEEKRNKKYRSKTKRAGRTNEASASVEKPAEGPPQEINENAQLDQYLQNAGFSGTAVIVKNGKVLLNKGYGMANKERKYRIIQRRLLYWFYFKGVCSNCYYAIERSK